MSSSPPTTFSTFFTRGKAGVRVLAVGLGPRGYFAEAIPILAIRHRSVRHQGGARGGRGRHGRARAGRFGENLFFYKYQARISRIAESQNRRIAFFVSIKPRVYKNPPQHTLLRDGRRARPGNPTL